MINLNVKAFSYRLSKFFQDADVASPPLYIDFFKKMVIDLVERYSQDLIKRFTCKK